MASWKHSEKLKYFYISKVSNSATLNGVISCVENILNGEIDAVTDCFAVNQFLDIKDQQNVNSDYSTY